MSRGRGGLVAVAAGLALFTTTPANAAASGGGAITGSYRCVDGSLWFVVHAPAFAFNGSPGSLRMVGSVSCSNTTSVLADYGFGTTDVTGPGVSCDDLYTGWQWALGELKLYVAGPCTTATGSQSVQFLGEAVASSGAFAGTVVVSPVL